MHATEALAEADRLMVVCNSCRYCEGLCAVFPAMEMRRSFADTDLNYLANLCHSCGACYTDCQFSPPHEFQVNVPQTLARVRNQSYAAYARPRMMARFFAGNDRKAALVSLVAVIVFALAFAYRGRNVDAARVGRMFYALMPHNAMAGVFGVVALLALLAMVLGLRAFWRDIQAPAAPSLSRSAFWAAIWRAMGDAARLRYLDGGGAGCEDEVKPDLRRFYHHFTFYGFVLCFAATSIATLYHYGFGREAPYPLWDLPVVLGTLGGIGLLIGPPGLYLAKKRRNPTLQDSGGYGMENAFLALLFLTAASGLALLALRATPLLAPALALHLGVVMGLFLTLPYGKFVHGIYRFAALVHYAMERKAHG